MPSEELREAAEQVLRIVRPIIHDPEEPDFAREDARDVAALANRVLSGCDDEENDR